MREKQPSLPLQPQPMEAPQQGVDAVDVLTLYVVTLSAVPSRLTIPALGGIGAPATIIAIGCTALWAWGMLARWRSEPFIIRPIRRALFFYFASLTAAFIAASARPISPQESQSAQSTMLVAIGWIGVPLLAGDFIPTRARLELLLRRISLAAGLLAALGIAQYVSGLSLTNYIQIPGLTLNQSLSSLSSRDGLNRPASTALHAIEFGVSMAALLPIALHVALYIGQLSRLRRWVPVAAIGIAIPLSISRSAIVGVVVVFVILLPTWEPPVRRAASALIVVIASFVFVAIPGVIGTLSGLFAVAAEDSSALSRTGSYALAGEFIARAPLFGRGPGTFLPRYRILDNQYLLSLIEAGLVGLTALLGVFVTSILCMVLVRRRTSDPATRDLAQSLFAGIASAGVSFSLFDALSFPQFSGFTLMLVGLAAALWRLEAGPRHLWINPRAMAKSIRVPVNWSRRRVWSRL